MTQRQFTRVFTTGLRPYGQVGAVLGLAEAAIQNVTLVVGSVSEKVTVEGVAPLLNTTNSNVESDRSAHQHLYTTPKLP